MFRYNTACCAGLADACAPSLLQQISPESLTPANHHASPNIAAIAGRRKDGSMSLHVPPYQPLPAPGKTTDVFKVSVAALHPTQMCVGLAEVRSRQVDFSQDSRDQLLQYLKRKPVPIVRNASGRLWMVDRHHRLRGLIELDPDAEAYGYVVLELATSDRASALEELHRRGWLYLYDGRGLGPMVPAVLPETLLGLQDDPYRSLIWKLKKEGMIEPAPLIPFHEFRWGAWLRRRPLPPFSSSELDPARPAARSLVRSPAAAHLAGWKGRR